MNQETFCFVFYSLLFRRRRRRLAHRNGHLIANFRTVQYVR